MHLSVRCFQALEEAFLVIDGKITTEDVIKELVQIAGRPTEEPPVVKVSPEDDCEYTADTETCDDYESGKEHNNNRNAGL